ncbi:MAG: STAS domain-containing protein [Deltaproteobacteria bacterium]|nr:STAS domain-containing protein [Deltaproteobacteria bacterium]
MNKILNLLPFLKWFQGYNTQHLKGDLVSGLTVALVLIPQSMAYAQLAGLPSYYGLYASFLPPVAAALFGSSRQLATGAVAVVSLLAAVALEPLATAGSTAYISYAILLALMVGGFQFLLGILKLGLVVNFLSHPVINGFTNAAAIIIATAQLPKLLGVHVDKAQRHYETLFRVVQAAVHYTHWPTLAMGVSAFIIMYGLKRVSLKIPNILVAVVITVFLSWALDFEHNKTADINNIASEDTRHLILEFNDGTKTILQMMDERSLLNQQADKAKKEDKAVDRINAQRDVQILSHLIIEKQEQVRILRQKLRFVLLEDATDQNGKPIFFLKGMVPEDKKSDRRTWRFQLGDSLLDVNALTLKSGGEVIGFIPGGLPPISFPVINFSIMTDLFPSAVIIALLGFMEAISIAKALAAKTGQRIDPNQELIGQGIANMVGALGKSYPCAGSFSRSAVNLQAGAVSGMSSVFTGMAVVVTLVFFTPLLYNLPQSVLAAIIMMAVTGLINVKGFIHAWRAQWYDGLISVICFACTLAFAPHLDKGIMVGVGLSLCVFLYKSMRPKVVDLSLGLDMALHDVVSFGLKECEYIAVVRFDGPLFFANAGYLEDQIRHRRKTKKNLRHIIIASEGINDIDASGQESLSLTVDRVRSAGIDISLSAVNESVMKVLKRTHLYARIGADHIYPSMKRAIRAIYHKTHQGGKEKNCPLAEICTTPDNRQSSKELKKCL